MNNTYTPQKNYTTKQLKMPIEISRIIEISDPVYSFCEIMDGIDLKKYLAVKESKTGRKRYNPEILLKIILFAFMENGYASVREIEKYCKTDIRYMWLLDGRKAPSFMTIDNFMREDLSVCISDIFTEINSHIFTKEKVDLNHVYIDGTKISANANKYSWVWKKSSVKNRQKTFEKVTVLLKQINEKIAGYGVKFGIRSEYAIEYLEELLQHYVKLIGIKPESIIRGRGHHKTIEQRYYDKLSEYTETLKRYATHIRICGEERNSYSKSDHDATFMRMKKDYMGNDQLLPGYNIQLGICDEYIAVCDVKQYASDMDCFQPLMEKFYETYGKYPEYPVADAGYGSFNNYLYCEEHGMKKYMKFTMFKKESEDEKYRDDPFRAVNFKVGENGNPVCPNGKEFTFLYKRPVRGNKYGRTEELYQCEDCENCPYRERCHTSEKNRIVRINEELTGFHKEVLNNLNSIQGAFLRMNRSIQAEGAFGTIKWNKSYQRIRRRGLKSVIFEISMISCGFNLHKFHLKQINTRMIA